MEPDRSESLSERADRNFSEAVQELRVAQTGVTVLFAFLLSLAFLGEISQAGPPVSGVYTAALLCSAGAAIVFIAPVAFHRLHFRKGLKEQLLWLTHAIALAGLVLLLAAMALSMWIVIDELWTRSWAAAVVLGVVAFALVVWVVVPQLALRRQVDERGV